MNLSYRPEAFGFADKNSLLSNDKPLFHPREAVMKPLQAKLSAAIADHDLVELFPLPSGSGFTGSKDFAGKDLDTLFLELVDFAELSAVFVAYWEEIQGTFHI